MHRLRRLALNHNAIAIFVIAVALAMKLLMPAGFMPAMSNGRIVVSVCSGSGPTTMVMAIPGMERDGTDQGKPDGRQSPPCAFSGLSSASLATADPILLAAAVAFALALGFRVASPPPVASPARLRPPLRGPPATV